MTKCSKFINETMGNIKSQLKEAIKSRILIGLVPPLNRFFFFFVSFLFFLFKGVWSAYRNRGAVNVSFLSIFCNYAETQLQHGVDKSK